MSKLNALRYVSKKSCDWLRDALRRSQRNRIERSGWLFNPQACGSELEALGRSTEGEFLAIGEKLHDYHRRSEEISGISASVGELMTGEEMEAAIEGFRNVIGHVRDLEGKSRQSATALKRLLAVFSDLHDHLSGFNKIIRSLRILCVSTKIESTRLNGRDMSFNILAEEVGKLGLEIESRHSKLMATTESIRNLVGQALFKACDLETRQHIQSGIILDKTVSSLESLTEKHSLSSRSATHIAARYDSISRNIGEIVSSMQFHDITRQRIEHVKEALDSIGLEQTKERVHAGDSREQLSLAVGICELQIAQLQTARQELVFAVENILVNLRGVAGVVSEMTQETQAMAGTANATGDSFLAEVEAGFSSMTSAFSTYAEADRELSSIMDSVVKILADMSSHTSSMVTVKEKIKLIALNAIVKACHIGNEGASLGVLAENIHQLSIETQQRTEEVSSDLRSMTFESESLCTLINAGNEGEDSDLVSIHEVVSALLSTLGNVNQRIMTLLARMHDRGLALSNEILKDIEAVDVHHRVESVIDTVVSRLDENLAPLRSLFLIDGRSGMADRIKGLETSYTMQGERDVHRALLAGGGAPALPDSEPATFAAAMETGVEQNDGRSHEHDEENLGDNVEFF